MASLTLLLYLLIYLTPVQILAFSSSSKGLLEASYQLRLESGKIFLFETKDTEILLLCLLQSSWHILYRLCSFDFWLVVWLAFWPLLPLSPENRGINFQSHQNIVIVKLVCGFKMQDRHPWQDWSGLVQSLLNNFWTALRGSPTREIWQRAIFLETPEKGPRGRSKRPLCNLLRGTRVPFHEKRFCFQSKTFKEISIMELLLKHFLNNLKQFCN